jgi:hypothetical protein
MQKNAYFIKAPFEGGISDGRIKRTDIFPDCFVPRRDGKCRRPCECSEAMMKEMHILNMTFMILVACILSSCVNAHNGFEQTKHKDGTVTGVSESGLKLYVKSPVLKGESDVSAHLTLSSHAVTQDFSVSN